jgi:hypothetical protein
VSVETRRKSGRTRYVTRWRQDGRQLARTFDRRSDAEAFERERRREAALGAFGPAEPARMALREWLEVWWRRGEVRWARSTRLHRAAILDKWITPYLEGVRLCDLAPARVREWQGAIRAAGCSAKQANQALRVLSATWPPPRGPTSSSPTGCAGSRASSGSSTTTTSRRRSTRGALAALASAGAAAHLRTASRRSRPARGRRGSLRRRG